VIVNIAGARTEEFVELARRLTGVAGVAALELNLSCPNVKEGGLSFSASPATCADTVGAVRRATTLPIFAKLTPNVSDVAAVARAAEAAGADGLSLINTLLAMAVDWRRRRGLIATLTGGLSGPAVKPIALRMVHEVARAVKIPVIGIGGAATATDVLEFMVAGARAVQIGTATFVDPLAIPKAIADLHRLLDAEGISRVADIVGTLAPS
jgi:dihydroorotate dehydrogenase (NAD+) catalytic subunit